MGLKVNLHTNGLRASRSAFEQKIVLTHQTTYSSSLMNIFSAIDFKFILWSKITTMKRRKFNYDTFIWAAKTSCSQFKNKSVCCCCSCSSCCFWFFFYKILCCRNQMFLYYEMFVLIKLILCFQITAKSRFSADFVGSSRKVSKRVQKLAFCLKRFYRAHDRSCSF